MITSKAQVVLHPQLVSSCWVLLCHGGFANLSPCRDEFSPGMAGNIGGFVSCGCAVGCPGTVAQKKESKQIVCHTQSTIFSWLLGFPQLSTVVKNTISDTGELQPPPSCAVLRKPWKVATSPFSESSLYWKEPQRSPCSNSLPWQDYLLLDQAL